MNFLSELHEYLRPKRAWDIEPSIQKAKKYPRFPQIALPTPQPLSISLSDVLQKRTSARSRMDGPLPLAALSAILKNSMGIRPDGHRPHPSGGGRYPLEAYILAFNIETLPRAVFHYRPDTHAIEQMWALKADEHATVYVRDTGESGSFKDAPAIIIINAVWDRSSSKYGDFAYRLSLIETGHIGQNIVLAATALGLRSCPFGGFNTAALIQTLDVDAQSEQPIYALALGEQK